MEKRVKQEYKTSSRAGILDYLKQNRQRTVSAGEIHTHMKAQNRQVNMTTIYRYLEKLEAEGNLMQYTPQSGEKNGCVTYQYVDSKHKCGEHLHLKCVQCGFVEHMDCDFMKEIASHIAAEHGFALECKGSVLYGLCKSCRGQGR